MNPKTILVRTPNWIGDQVLAYPFFYYLRQAYPQAYICAVCVDWVKNLQFHNLINEIRILTKPSDNSLWERIKAIEADAKTLREMRQWDLAISLPNSFSAAWLLYRAKAKIRRGYKTDGRGFLLNNGLKWDADPERHRAQAYLDLLPEGATPKRPAKEFWGVPVAAGALDPPIPGELSHFDVEKSWPGVEPIEPPAEPFWILAPGATALSRRWPEEYFANVARHIFNETGWRGLIIGGRSEGPIAARLCQDKSLRLLDLTAKGPITLFWKHFRQAQFTLCNESGLAHVAALCGSFVQIVCGAADPRRTTPIGPGRVKVMMNPVECWPCERNFCEEPKERFLRCLKGINPDSVWEEIKRELRR